MKEYEIELNGKIYVNKEKIREYLENENNEDDSEIKLYDVVKYCGYEWYVIKIEEDGIVLSIKNVLPKDDMQEIFDEKILDNDGDIPFSYQSDNFWWKDSPIRMGLNSEFLRQKLNHEDLVIMKSTICYEDEENTTFDYVRLLSKKEIEELPMNVRIKRDRYWYWSFSPLYFYGSGAYVSRVNEPGYLGGGYVANAGGVAPVIKLKTEVFDKLNK